MSWHREVVCDGWSVDIRDEGSNEWTTEELAPFDPRRKGLCHVCSGTIKTALYFQNNTREDNRLWLCGSCAARRGIIW